MYREKNTRGETLIGFLFELPVDLGFFFAPPQRDKSGVLIDFGQCTAEGDTTYAIDLVRKKCAVGNAESAVQRVRLFSDPAKLLHRWNSESLPSTTGSIWFMALDLRTAHPYQHPSRHPDRHLPGLHRHPRVVQEGIQGKISMRNRAVRARVWNMPPGQRSTLFMAVLKFVCAFLFNRSTKKIVR